MKISLVLIILVLVVLVSGCSKTERVYETKAVDTPEIKETRSISSPTPVASPSPTENVTQGNHTVGNTRWGKTSFTIFIDSESSIGVRGFNQDLIGGFREAVKLLENSTGGKLSFNFINGKNADITVKWVDSLPSDSLDAIGHTELLFNVGTEFNVIKEAEIKLLALRDGQPIKGHGAVLLSLHELGHAIGLNHSPRKDSMMYPQLQEKNQDPSKEDVQIIETLYKIDPLPELKIINASVTKRVIQEGFYRYNLADVNFSVINEGLVGSGTFGFSITVGDQKIKSDSEKLSKGRASASIDPGATFTVSYQNISSSIDFSSVEIAVDEENLIKEFNENNNFKTIEIQ